jgi:hypothetical protein
MAKNIFWLIIINIALAFTSCNLINKKEKVPVFIQVNSVSFNSEGKGSNSQNIVNVWIYADDSFIGTFEIPCKVPILKSGKVKLKIKAGIYSDGIKTNRYEYPFFKEFTNETILEEGKVYEINPVFTYLESIKFPYFFYEDFEDGVNRFDSTSNSTTGIRLTKADDFKSIHTGDFIGKITLKANTPDAFRVVSKNEYGFPRGGRNVFLEFDYISTVKFGVGITSESTFENKIDLVMNPNNNWTKVYVPLMEEIGTSSPNAKFKVAFESSSQSTKDEQILLDNIKIITFE